MINKTELERLTNIISAKFDRKATDEESIDFTPSTEEIGDHREERSSPYSQIQVPPDWNAIYQQLESWSIMFDPKAICPDAFGDIMALLKQNYIKQHAKLLSTASNEEITRSLADVSDNYLESLNGYTKEEVGTIKQVLDFHRQNDEISLDVFERLQDEAEFTIAHLARVTSLCQVEQRRRQG